MGMRLEQVRQVDKTAAYTISPDRDRPGTIFTNLGASGSVTFTLPTPTRAIRGWWYDFKGLVDQVIVVAAPTVDTLVGFNDLAADSVQSGGSGQRIGASIRATVVQTGTNTFQWFVEYGSQGITYVLNT